MGEGVSSKASRAKRVPLSNVITVIGKLNVTGPVNCDHIVTIDMRNAHVSIIVLCHVQSEMSSFKDFKAHP